MTVIHKYRPSLAEAISWDDIEHFYNDLISNHWPVQEIIPLIQLIKRDDQLRNKLHACTSLDKLIISIYNPIELWREAIYIQYDKENQLWNFKYYPHPYHEPEHERNYTGALLVEKFKSYIDMLRW